MYKTVITANKNFLDFNLRELIHYKDLIWLLVKKYYSLKYKQTLLGPLWLILNPFITILINTVIFGVLAKFSTEGIPKVLFFLAGNTIWAFFADSVSKNADTFLGNAGLFGKVYFPRIVVPISNVLINFFDFCIQLFIMLCMIIFYNANGANINCNSCVLLLPLVLLQLGLLGMGLGVFFSAVTIRYRDLKVISSIVIRIWMYASPVVYALSAVPQKYLNLYMLNPATPAICIFKYAFFGTGVLPLKYFGFSCIVSVVVAFFGIMVFNRVERNFVDTV